MYKADKQLWIDLYNEDPDEFNEKVKEECFEFGMAYCHWLDDKVEDIDLAIEIADMFIQIEKILAVNPKLQKDFLHQLAVKQNMIRDWVYFNPNDRGGKQ